MASRSKKRRRVLAASCILAALIVAGSSFAWFTSKDEVTNRLSANADYDVQIVESFAPPANWLPGQKVDKDVYATNTGSIPAYAQVTIGNYIGIRREVEEPAAYGRETVFSPMNENLPYVELSEEERYVIEDGSFLVYTPEGSNLKLGNQVVVRPDDRDDTKVQFDFTPDVQGLYVFRRSITSRNSSGNYGTAKITGTESFTYDGYYYVPASARDSAKYLKISNLKVEEDRTPDYIADGINNDGYLLSATAGFYRSKVSTETLRFEYAELNAEQAAEEGVEPGKYLIAPYDTTKLGYDPAADMKDRMEYYDEVVHNYQLAIELRTKALSEKADAINGLNDAQTALNDAKDALIDALDTQAEKAAAFASAKVAYKNLSDEKNQLQSAQSNLLYKMYGKSGGSTADYTNNSVYAKSIEEYESYTTANIAERLRNEVALWLETDPDGVSASAASLDDLTYDELMLFTPSAELHTYCQNILAVKKAEKEYNELLAEYNSNEARLAQIGDGTSDDLLLDTARQEMEAAEGELNTANTAVTDAQTAYNDAYEEVKTKLAEYGVSADKTDEAEKRYNQAYDRYITVSRNRNYYDLMTSDLPDTDAGILKIFVKLTDDVIIENDGSSNGKWQMLPSAVGYSGAVFYYTGILEGGETSVKLVDDVTLSKKANQDMYDYFDFDLNISLKSAQVTYDEEGRITNDAANDELDADVTVKEPASIESALVWTAKN